MRRIGWHVSLRALMVAFALTLTACTNNRNVASSDLRLDALTEREPDAQRQRAMRRLQLASVYFEQGQHEVAKQEVRAALEIDPAYAQSFNLLGLIHQRQNAPELAQQSFDQALRLAAADGRAQWARVQHNYGWFLCERAQFAQGQSALQQALAQPGYPEAVKSWLVLGDCQQRAGQLDQAQHSWRQAQALEPHNPWIKQRLTQPEM